MRVKDWREHEKISRARLAEAIGLPSTQGGLKIARIERGEVRAEADIVQAIIEFSGGAVGLQDLHETRLEWLADQKAEAAQ